MTNADREWQSFLRRTEAPAVDEAFVLALIERIEREHAARVRRRSFALALIVVIGAAAALALPRGTFAVELASVADCLVALLTGVALSELLGRVLLPGTSTGPAIRQS